MVAIVSKKIFILFIQLLLKIDIQAGLSEMTTWTILGKDLALNGSNSEI